MIYKVLAVLENLFNPRSNAVETAKILLNLLKVNIETNLIEREIEGHSDFPSLLSISDTLTAHGVENMAMKIPTNQISEVPTPFLAPIKKASDNVSYFTVIKSIENNSVSYWDPPKHKWTSSSISQFVENWSGIVLLAQPDKNIGEHGGVENRRIEKRKELKTVIFFICPLAMIFLTGILTFITQGKQAIFPLVFSIFSLIGFYIGLLILVYEVDQHNPVLQQICGAGKKTGCAEILQSKFAKIMGISWSSIGLSYFSGLIFLYVFNSLSNPSILLQTAWISTAAIVYILFSVIYQWWIVKKWCILCLSIQFVLFFQFIIVSIADWRRILPIVYLLSNTFVSIMFGFIISFLIINLLIPLYKTAKEKRHLSSELQRMKYNPDVFLALLRKQQSINQGTEKMGITIGSPNAKYKIIKVCNPYCGPCSAAHLIIEEIIENNSDVQVQIIFNASGEETDAKTKPVRHFLAIASGGNELVLKNALDDWYRSQDYESFARKYPVSEDSRLFDAEIRIMTEWCKENKIKYTPTFFINDYQLPDIFSISDVKHILSYRNS